MRIIILTALAAVLVLGGCSKEENKPAPQQTTTPKAEENKVSQKAEEMAGQVKEKATEMAEQAKEKTVQMTKQIKEKAAQAEQKVKGMMETSSSGEAIYTKNCVACHKSGVMGAPKTGDKAAWAPRIADGIDKLTETAIKGTAKMPPKGGNADLSDDEVRAAVEYMVGQSK